MAVNKMPAAEVDIGPDLVRGLLTDQHPDLAGLPLVDVAHGWDNVIYRLGTELTVRIPRRAMSAALAEHELRWLPELAPRLPLPIPAPVRAGRPGRGYPWSWSVTPWFDGDIAARAEPDDFTAAGEALGLFVRALNQPAPSDAPVNPYRGVPLTERDAVTRDRINLLGTAIDQTAVAASWTASVNAPPWSGPPLWLHGDLHPANLLVRDGRLAAVIDFGDITGGDPASDLAAAWMWLPAGVRPIFRAAAGGADDDTWLRARGWALSHALAVLHNAADNPLMAGIGRATLDAVLVDSR
ncbi:MAG: aminoglycoside phosphotransferase family protein [Acidimicrobiia bacterium]